MGTSPLSLRVTVKGRNFLPGEQNLSFESIPQFLNDTVNTVEVKSKI